MNNNTLQVKFKQRLNKIDSQDYDNIKSWEIAEAFNKSQIEWCRRQLAGTNMRKEGDEMSKRRIDDLSLLLKTVKLEGVDIQYDNTFGYFNATNFATIDLTATTNGYWVPDLTLFYEELFNLRVFTFTTVGNNSVDLSGLSSNILPNWGNYGDVQDITPQIAATEITTQQPWVHNINENGLWYSDNDPNNNIYNTNIILPFHTDGNLSTACNYCNKTSGDILADATMLTAMCAGSPTGYIVGGPHNEYIDCSAVPATAHAIPNLSSIGTINAIQYNYTNAGNEWVNTTGNIFGGELCALNACWFTPTSVEIQTMSLNNFQTDAFDSPPTPVTPTAPDAWGNVDYTLTGTLDAQTNTEGTYIEPTSTQYQVDVTRPGLTIDKCYCAPGTNPINFCTVPRTLTVYQSEVANVDVLLRDNLKNPNFEWCETFCTLQNNEIRIWRKNFYIMDPVLIYYRTPRRIEILGSVDPYTGNTVAVDVPSEFKDDLVEVIIDNAVSLLAGDISDANQMIRGEQAAEKNN
jgi:hypothetical protein